MPQAVAIPIITGVASVAGAGIAAHGASRAANAQGRATRQAIGLEREREAEARRRYDMQWQRYQTDLDAYNQRRIAILRRHGYDIPDAAPAGGGAPGAGPGAPQPGTLGQTGPGGPAHALRRMGAVPAGLQVAGPAGGAPWSPAGSAQSLTPAEGAPPPGQDPALMQGENMSLTNLPRNWSDWRRYGA